MRFGRQVLFGLGSLLAVVVAIAAAATARAASAQLLVRPPSGFPYLWITPATTALCATVVAGAISALYLLGARLPRAPLVVIGLVPVAWMAYLQYLTRNGPTTVGPVRPTEETLRDAVLSRLDPTVAGAVLGLAVIVAAVTRRHVPTYLSPLQSAAWQSRGAAGPAVLGLVAGAVAWFAAGFAVVALAAAGSFELVDFNRQRVEGRDLAFASEPVLLVASGLAAVICAALVVLLVSRRIPAAVPIVVGLAYAGMAVAFVVTARLAADNGSAALPASTLLAALREAALAPGGLGGGAALLGTVLIIAGVHRLRHHPREPAPAPAEPPDPTIPLFQAVTSEPHTGGV